MSRVRTRRPAGAERRTEASPFGDRELRLEWASRIAALQRLDDAVIALIDLREKQALQHMTDKDTLWIGARLEDRVAVLRFEERTHQFLRTSTLTGEPIDEVVESFERRAAAAGGEELEVLAADLRRLYKPPIMPTTPYLRLEAKLSELLMKRRSLNWFEPSMAELRVRRGVRILKEGWPDRAPAPSV